MTQALYAHMNNKTTKKKKNDFLFLIWGINTPVSSLTPALTDSIETVDMGKFPSLKPQFKF
jgi:hypothetical protein